MANYNVQSFKDGEVLFAKNLNTIEDYLAQCLNISVVGTMVNNNDDLNEYKTPGVYYINKAAIKNINNLPPIQNGAKLIVLKHYSSKRFVQFVFESGEGYDKIFYRFHEESSDGTISKWLNWNLIPRNLNDLGITVDANTINQLSEYVYDSENKTNKLKAAIDKKLGKSETAAAAKKVSNKLIVGTKEYDGSSKVEITAADLGLDSTIKFIGVVNALPKTANQGDVVLFGKKEYIYTTNGWVELGDEGSYVLKTIAVTGDNGLTSDGDLSTGVTISHAEVGTTVDNTLSAGTSKNRFLHDIKLDKYGHIVGVEAANFVPDALIVTDDCEIVTVDVTTGAATSGFQVTGKGIVNVSTENNSNLIISANIEAASGTDIGEYGDPYVSTETANDKTIIGFHNLRGKGIKGVEQTLTSTEDNGINEITFTLDDNSTEVFQVRNGSRGAADISGLGPADIGAAEAEHTHTYNEVGAAPAKISTGHYELRSKTDLEAKLFQVIQSMENQSIRHITAIISAGVLISSAGLWEFTIYKNSNTDCRVDGHYIKDSINVTVHRSGTTWTEWEYVNPPMDVDVEYRTTEHIDGKAVYKKRDSNDVIMYRLEDSNTWTEGLPGAAPAGYGLGETGVYCADCNNVYKNGWYEVDVNTANLPAEGIAGTLSVHSIATDNGTDVYQTITSGATTIQRYYSSWAGAWQPWEWVNPPMQEGVEYRTTERWDGKPVYKMYIDYGDLPANEETHNIIDQLKNAKLISVNGYGGRTTSDGKYYSYAIPGFDGISRIGITLSTGNLWIVTKGDALNIHAYLTISYIKEA